MNLDEVIMSIKPCSVHGCKNTVEPNRLKLICGTHRWRMKKYNSYDLPTITLPDGFIKDCKVHVLLTTEQVTFRQCNGANSPKSIYCKQCLSIGQIRRNRLDPDRVKLNRKKTVLKKLFNLTYDEYLLMLKTQHNLCLICNNPEKDIDKRTGLVRALSVDHCHNTGKVRGLLCSTCNLGLGYFKDSPSLLKRAIKYIS